MQFMFYKLALTLYFGTLSGDSFLSEKVV